MSYLEKSLITASKEQKLKVVRFFSCPTSGGLASRKKTAD
jgi:hypothetical protein